MSATVRIPTSLRSFTGGAADVDAEGATLATVIANLEARYPGIAAHILNGTGTDLRSNVRVYVDTDDVRSAKGLETEIGNRTEISIVPVLGGV